MSYSGKVKPMKVSKRPRKSPYPMLSMSEAIQCVMSESYSLETEWKDFKDCFSHVLAKDIVANEPYPPFEASIKDGYAVLADDVTELRRVIGVVTPGAKLDFDIQHGCCVRVSTGSAIPPKANAVIQVEDTNVVEEDELGNEITIKILKPATEYQDIRKVGSDVSVDEVLLPKHHVITAAGIGVMVTSNIQRALVYRKPCVALLSTGDEILKPSEPMKPGCIRDSNKSSLMCILEENRIPFIDVGIARDRLDDVKLHLEVALKAADIIVTTGGVSMGEKDMLKQVLETDFSAVVHFGRIHMKPGKPTTFSTVLFEGKKKLIFSLPGNPVSAFVTFHLFVMPCIKKLMGHEKPEYLSLHVQLGHDISLDERPEYYRAILKPNDEGTFVASGTGAQQSSRLLSTSNANALLVLPPKTPEQTVLKAGSKVLAMILQLN